MSAPQSAVATPAAAAPVIRTPAPAVTQWDRCLENGAIKTFWGGVVGGLAALVLFRTGGARFAATGLGAGFGAGGAFYEAKQVYAPSRFQNSLLTPAQNEARAAAAATLPRCGRASCKCGPNCKCAPVGFATVKNGVVPTFDVKSTTGSCCK